MSMTKDESITPGTATIGMLAIDLARGSVQV